MRLYIQQAAKMIENQLGCLYRHLGAISEGAALFLICTSLITTHLSSTATNFGCIKYGQDVFFDVIADTDSSSDKRATEERSRRSPRLMPKHRYVTT